MWQSLRLYRKCHFDGQGRDSALLKVSSGLLSVFPGEIYVVLFALRPLLRARAEAKRSNKVRGTELQ